MNKMSRMIEVKYQIVKNGAKTNELSIEEIDVITRELLEYLGELTQRGVTHIMDVSIDVYKERVWNLIERVGLLEE